MLEAPALPACRSRTRRLACARLAGFLLGSLLAVSPAVAIPGALSPAGLAGFSSGGMSPSAPRTAARLIDDDVPLNPAQFDTTAAPLPRNLASLGFESTATSEFGDLVRLSGAGHYIDSVTVTMSSWAIRSDYPGSPPLGFTHPITLTLYAVDRTGGAPRPGKVLAALTQAFLVPWRPEPDAASTSPLRPWRAADGNYYAGLAFNLNFDLGSLGLTLPDEVIFSVSFNTQHHGPAPIGAPGPYNQLHLAASDRTPQPGVDVEPDAVFWKTARGTGYADGGHAGLNTFRRDTGWTPFKPAIRFTNSAYGTIADTAELLRTLHSSDTDTARSIADATRLLSFALPRGLWNGHNRLDGEYGNAVFELLAEAGDVLRPLASNDGPIGSQAGQAIDTLLVAAQSLAETGLGDAIIAGGNARRISRSQAALDDAHEGAAGDSPVRAIDDFGRAWQQARQALPW